MDGARALGRLAQWLLAQNSLAARLLSRYPHLLEARLAAPRPGRIGPPPRLNPDGDEEEALAALREWLAEGLVSLLLEALFAGPRPERLAGRLSRLTGQMVGLCLAAADAALRRRYTHPLLLPAQAGPGPVVVLGGGELTGAELGFDQPLDLVFAFTRRQPFARPLSEAELDRAMAQSGELIIFKEYVLKLAQRVIDYLSLDNPRGPGLRLAAPRSEEPGRVGPQIVSLGRWLDFFRHQASDAQLLGLTRLSPLLGQASLSREIRRLTAELLLARPWTAERLAAALAGLRRPEAEEFDPLTGSGGLKDLGLVLDGLLLGRGVVPSGPTPTRLKRAQSLGLLRDGGAELAEAHQSLLAAHLCLSLLGHGLPGHDLAGVQDLEAALALWPRPTKTELPLAQAREAVSRALTRLVEV